MYLSLNWLKDFLGQVGGLKPEDIATGLTAHTVEVEKVERQSERFDKIVIGKVLETEKHPDADRLKLAQVDVGATEPLKIVCGGPNLEAGQLVPVALIGAKLPNDLVIEERSVRGEISQGMICAEDELGLGDDHSGIMVLDKEARPGRPFAEYLKFDDVIFEVDNKSITNRPDLWGHLGMAREIAVFASLPTSKAFKNIFEGKIETKNTSKLSITIEDKEVCRRYSAVKIENLSVQESPKKIADRLTAAGMRPINNIVDATNYVMLELGQPLHAFDADKDTDLIVRHADKGEKIITIDDQERELDQSMLLIANKEEPLAIAGIIGGKGREISVETKAIILESANFEASSIRRTSTKLGLRTESSMRFEKSLDPTITIVALARCLKILKETCPKAQIASAIFDEDNSKIEEKTVSLNLLWLKKMLGDDMGDKKVKEIISGLGFGINDDIDGCWQIKVPSWRMKDINSREDIVEEVARIYGYNNLHSAMPSVLMAAPLENKERSLERKVKGLLSGRGMFEVYNYSFVSEEKLKKLNINPSGYLKLLNPVSSVQTLLRQNLFTNLLENIKINQAKREKIALFEIGNVFIDTASGLYKDKKEEESLPYQENRLGLMMAAVVDPYQDIKGFVEYLFADFGFEVSYEISEMSPDWADKRTYALIMISGLEIGFVSKFESSSLSGLGIKKEVAVAEISFGKFFEFVSASEKKYRELAKYPAVERDLAFVVDNKVLYNNIKREIEAFDPLIVKVELFDVYEGGSMEKNKKSLAFHVNYQSPERTLSSTETDKLLKKLSQRLEEKFNAKIRNF